MKTIDHLIKIANKTITSEQAVEMVSSFEQYNALADSADLEGYQKEPHPLILSLRNNSKSSFIHFLNATQNNSYLENAMLLSLKNKDMFFFNELSKHSLFEKIKKNPELLNVFFHKIISNITTQKNFNHWNEINHFWNITDTLAQKLKNCSFDNRLFSTGYSNTYRINNSGNSSIDKTIKTFLNNCLNHKNISGIKIIYKMTEYKKNMFAYCLQENSSPSIMNFFEEQPDITKKDKLEVKTSAVLKHYEDTKKYPQILSVIAETLSFIENEKINSEDAKFLIDLLHQKQEEIVSVCLKEVNYPTLSNLNDLLIKHKMSFNEKISSITSSYIVNRKNKEYEPLILIFKKNPDNDFIYVALSKSIIEYYNQKNCSREKIYDDTFNEMKKFVNSNPSLCEYINKNKHHFNQLQLSMYEKNYLSLIKNNNSLSKIKIL